MQNINWYVFTKEERDLIQKAIDSGDTANVVCLVADVNMDQEKEAEIQKIVDNMRPEDDNFISEVEEEVTRVFIEGTPETEKNPELEAEMQKKLDEEKEAFVAKKRRSKKAAEPEVKVDEEAEEKEEEKTNFIKNLIKK